jgi:NAD(P)H-hydrate epimerase
MVLDADALNLIAAHPKLKKYLHGKILTPHPKEMARLLKKPLKEVLRRRYELTRRFAKTQRCYVVLKSYRSIMANPKGEVWINSTGGPNLAVAGSGDVLTGIIAGLLAQGLSPWHALLAGVYLHGRAGDELARRLGDRGTLASEIAAEVPKVIKKMIEKS